MLLLLGRKEDSAAGFEALNELAGQQMMWSGHGPGPGTPPTRIYLGAIVDFSRGKVTADELVRLVQSSRWFLDVAHYVIGVSQLADGDRRGAEEHFRKAIGANNFYDSFTDWSRNFLVCLKKVPAWPLWIPVKN